MKIRILLVAAALAVSGAVHAKLPEPTEEAKAQAAEKKAKADEAAAKAAAALAAVQDRVAARWMEEQRAKGQAAQPSAAAAN